jgi:hypothetical protein
MGSSPDITLTLLTQRLERLESGLRCDCHVRYGVFERSPDRLKIVSRNIEGILIVPPLNLVSEFAHRTIQIHNMSKCSDLPPLRKSETSQNIDWD